MQRLLLALTEPLIPRFSEGRARLHLGENRAHYGEPADSLEAFARPLWGLVPLQAGGGEFPHWNLWQAGLATGSDPACEEFWGYAGDFDQRSVEQAALGFGLALAPDQLWEPLDAFTKARLSAWLRRINQVRLVPTNWEFFRVMVNLGLRRCGEPWSVEQVASTLDGIERFHLGRGWYTDGLPNAPYRNGRTGDYYVPWAFHFYSLIYARLADEADPVRAGRYRERAADFAPDFAHWFSADGAALPFGRSLCYRTAQGAFWGALAFADVEALPWPVIKGLYLRHLRWWMQRPIFTDGGLLSVGYTYPNLLMAESYNSPSSPYWAFKVFLPLALPESHPFWQAEEAPMPPRRAVHSVPQAKLVMCTDPITREVTALSPGQPCGDWPRNVAHKYSKCAYSTRFGFSVPASLATETEGGFDNTLALSEFGRHYRSREYCLNTEVENGVAYAFWLPWPDVEVRSWVIADLRGHFRVHHIRSGRSLQTLESGFAVNWTRRASIETVDGLVRTPQGASTIRSLGGDRQPGYVDLGANSHLLDALASMPVLRSRHDAGSFWLACRVIGSHDIDDPFDEPAEYSLQHDSGGVSILRDGQAWWTQGPGACGHSSPERLLMLDTLV